VQIYTLQKYFYRNTNHIIKIKNYLKLHYQKYEKNRFTSLSFNGYVNKTGNTYVTVSGIFDRKSHLI
jgi:hypothetical protein